MIACIDIIRRHASDVLFLLLLYLLNFVGEPCLEGLVLTQAVQAHDPRADEKEFQNNLSVRAIMPVEVEKKLAKIIAPHHKPYAQRSDAVRIELDAIGQYEGKEDGGEDSIEPEQYKIGVDLVLGQQV